MDGYRLVGKIASTKAKFLVGQHHHLKFGHLPRARLVEENYYWRQVVGYTRTLSVCKGHFCRSQIVAILPSPIALALALALALATVEPLYSGHRWGI